MAQLTLECGDHIFTGMSKLHVMRIMWYLGSAAEQQYSALLCFIVWHQMFCGRGQSQLSWIKHQGKPKSLGCQVLALESDSLGLNWLHHLLSCDLETVSQTPWGLNVLICWMQIRILPEMFLMGIKYNNSCDILRTMVKGVRVWSKSAVRTALQLKSISALNSQFPLRKWQWLILPLS